MKRIASTLVIILFLTAILSTPLTKAQPASFQSLGRTFIYDVRDDGSVRCTWETTITPLQPAILYRYSFKGGEIGDIKATDSLGQELFWDVEEQGGRRNVTLTLTGYELNEAYTFNLSFTWNGLLTRENDRHTLFTSVNVGDPQQAKIAVILPKDATLGTSAISRGNITEVFERELVSGRHLLTWQVANTGNETAILFNVNFKHYNTLLWIQDNLSIIIVAIVIVIVGALLLGYGKRLRPLISRAFKSFLERS